MRKSLVFVGLIVALLASSLFAQESKVAVKSNVKNSIVKAKEDIRFVRKSAADLLWDNTDISITTTGLVSVELGGVNIKTISADDFVVPLGATWDITEVWVDGFASTANEPESFTVTFYTNDAGQPGTVVAQYTDIIPTGATGYTLDLTTKGSYTFEPGTYWVSVWGYYATAMTLDDGRWNWYMGSESIGLEPMLFDEGLFGGLPWTTMTDLGLGDFQSFMFALSGTATVQGPGYPSDPTIADGSIDVPVDGTVLSWTNPAGTSSNAVYFSSDQALVDGRDASVMVLGDGATAYDSYDPGTLEYGTTYYWAVDETEAAKTPGTTFGPTWSFITEFQYPMFEWVEDFSSGLDNWTTDGGGGLCDWFAFDQDNDAWLGAWQPANSGFDGIIAAVSSDICGSAMEATMTLAKGIDLSQFGNSMISFDSDFQDYAGATTGTLDISVDGGVTWTTVNTWDADEAANTHWDIDISAVADFQADVLIRFHYVDLTWGWQWGIDNVVVSAETPLNPVAGTLLYGNGNPVANATFMIYNDAKYVFQGTTDADGNYNLPEVPPGEYNFIMVSDLPEGAVNVLDAYLVSQQAMKIVEYPTNDMFYVSDVDGDMEVRYQDAQMIFARIFGDIDAFGRDDWYMANQTLVDFGHFIFVNMPATLYATGDADLSYGETVKPVRTLALEKSSVNVLPLTKEIEVPFYLGSDAEVAGAMLRFDYDNTAYSFTGVKSNLDKPYVINGDGFVSVMYLDKDVNFAAGDELLTLKFRVNDGVDVPEDFEVTLNDKSALMNKNGNLVNTSLQTVTFGEVLPTKYELSQNYPNPFNPSTKISFSLPQADVVTLKIYDILGSEVATLVNGKMEAGKYELNFDASNLPSGAYIYRIQTNNFQATKKMMLLK